MSPEEMLQRLRARAGRWHTLARFLPVLYQSGYDSGAVDEATGITPALQVCGCEWGVACMMCAVVTIDQVSDPRQECR